jgi:glycosyltransferase involved in cell wall biosynthesis
LAIEAVREYNRRHRLDPLKLVIAGKHYGSEGKNRYWTERIEPQIDGEVVVYEGFVPNQVAKQRLLAGARALIMPSTFDEPFGLVQIEALACGTPIVGLSRGAIGEVVRDGMNGVLVQHPSELPGALTRVRQIDRAVCRADFEARFTSRRMAEEHKVIYSQLVAASATTQSPGRP